MRFILLAIVLAVLSTMAVLPSARAQGENPFQDVLRLPMILKVAENDEPQLKLAKLCFNAAHKEMRIRYNYWTQGISEIEALLASIDRLHKLRFQIVPIANEIEFVEQKLAFVKEIESRCEKANSKAKFEALREIDEGSVAAFRIHLELELAKLKIASGPQAQLSGCTSAASNVVESPVRWEYKTCDGNGTGTDSPLELNRLGRDGWELVASICDNSAGGNGVVRHYLKRKLPK